MLRGRLSAAAIVVVLCGFIVRLVDDELRPVGTSGPQHPCSRFSLSSSAGVRLVATAAAAAAAAAAACYLVGRRQTSGLTVSGRGGRAGRVEYYGEGGH